MVVLQWNTSGIEWNTGRIYSWYLVAFWRNASDIPVEYRLFQWNTGITSGIPVVFQWYPVEYWQNLPLVKVVVFQLEYHWYSSGIPAEFTTGIPGVSSGKLGEFTTGIHWYYSGILLIFQWFSSGILTEFEIFT